SKFEVAGAGSFPGPWNLLVRAKHSGTRGQRQWPLPRALLPFGAEERKAATGPVEPAQVWQDAAKTRHSPLRPGALESRPSRCAIAARMLAARRMCSQADFLQTIADAHSSPPLLCHLMKPPGADCQCQGEAAFFADPLYRCPRPFRDLVEKNASKHPSHFDSDMLQLSQEDFQSGSHGYYRCNQCHQWWFLVFADEEGAWPIFGVKVTEESRRANVLFNVEDAAVSAAKQRALEELLGQSTEGRCAELGCENHPLASASLCSKHYGFPW
ncbi:hypothetical protein AB4Z46_33265, partial [Variovorax sp. M-6]|uniref:hypothetical protein n=1 Tax=Variovorax sp. M-6 TaxID=3233041 RepID=UPI003F971D9D